LEREIFREAMGERQNHEIERLNEWELGEREGDGMRGGGEKGERERGLVGVSKNVGELRDMVICCAEIRMLIVEQSQSERRRR